ncbi:MAG: hypothetical protein M3R17_10875 [Bacteroidota bacterium]|nr:hypothetical protein [Bacteroidota bacterium]
MNEKEALNITYKLISFKTVEFGFKTLKVEPTFEEAELIAFHSFPELAFSIENNIVVINFVIEVSKRKIVGSDVDRELFANIKTSFIFEVIDLKNHVAMDNNSLEILDERMGNFLIIITGTSYSTMRGIIAEKFKGTFLDKFSLPMIDPSTFFEPGAFSTKSNK